jgi:hypothetical protein
MLGDPPPRRPAGHDVQVMDVMTQSMGEQRAAAEDHEVTGVQVKLGHQHGEAANEPGF